MVVATVTLVTSSSSTQNRRKESVNSSMAVSSMAKTNGMNRAAALDFVAPMYSSPGRIDMEPSTLGIQFV
jgi:hypothetical protein